MQRKLTVELTIDEVKEAISQYVSSMSGDTVAEIKLEVSKLNELVCSIVCATEQIGEKNESKEEA